MKKSLHAICLSIILVLAVFVVREEVGDCDSILQREAQFSFRNARLEIENYNEKIFSAIEIYWKNYPSRVLDQLLNRAKNTAEKTFATQLLLDSLLRKPSPELACEVQGKLNVFRSEVFELQDFDPQFGESIPAFSPADWLFQGFKNLSSSQFLSLVEQTKVNVALIETAAMNDFLSRTSGSDIRMDRYMPVMSFDQISPKVGEVVAADVFLSAYPEQVSHFFNFQLNGKQLEERHGSATFKIGFEQAGNYPLHFSIKAMNWETDSVETWEKTYFLRVRE